jgi:hypothetical protein
MAPLADINLAGLVGFIDPLRPEAAPAVADSRRAEIAVKRSCGYGPRDRAQPIAVQLPQARLDVVRQAHTAHALVGDTSMRRGPESGTSPAIFLAALASNRTFGVVWNVNGFIARLPPRSRARGASRGARP